MDSLKVKAEMDVALSLLKDEMSSMRTGRATPSLVESVVITAYGGAQKLKVMELASISAQDAETLVIDPWDKSVIGEIRQGILAANIGLNPSIEGEIIRISLPPMTGEDRAKYVKLLHAKLENTKIMIRQIRGEHMKDIKRLNDEKEISEDERKGQEKELQNITDEYVEKIDNQGKQKERELLQV